MNVVFKARFDPTKIHPNFNLAHQDEHPIPVFVDANGSLCALDRDGMSFLIWSPSHEHFAADCIDRVYEVDPVWARNNIRISQNPPWTAKFLGEEWLIRADPNSGLSETIEKAIKNAFSVDWAWECEDALVFALAFGPYFVGVSGVYFEKKEN